MSRGQRVGLKCDNSPQDSFGRQESSVHQSMSAVSHSVGAHSPKLCDAHTDSDSDLSADDADASTSAVVATVSTPVIDGNDCEVCLIAQRDERIALAPCGHWRFCETCANKVERQGRGCPGHIAYLYVRLRLI